MTEKRGKSAADLQKCITRFCSEIAHPSSVTSICLCGNQTQGLSDGKMLKVLLIIKSFQPKLMSYVKFFGNDVVIVYAIDEWVFEKDIERGFLGEALAFHLIFPYTPLLNSDYLKSKELKLKRRLTLELLESLVLDFPELSYDIHIKPEYFMYEAALSRARLFPPLYNTLSSFLSEGAYKENIKNVMKGYICALEALEREKIVESLNGYIKISKEFIDAVKSKRTRFTNLLKATQKTLFMSFLGTFPEIFKTLLHSKPHLLKLQLNTGKPKTVHKLVDPKQFLFIPTPGGFISLSNNMDIKNFARSLFSANANIKIRKIGGVLNDVYLVKASSNGKEQKTVVKTFKDWSNVKWFSLSLWAFGTRSFALLGRSRLERECAINQLLHRLGFHVPKLLAVNPYERFIFMEYVEGESVEKIIKKIVEAKDENKIKECLEVLQRIGETFARIHALNITLGDTKPENILVGKKGQIYLLDFEQSSRGGDKSWDIAEFLYYSGHFIPPLSGSHTAEVIAKTFIQGYLKGGGNVKHVKEAGKAKYTKVFAFFALPNVLLAISNICKKADQLGLADGQ